MRSVRARQASSRDGYMDAAVTYDASGAPSRVTLSGAVSVVAEGRVRLPRDV